MTAKLFKKNVRDLQSPFIRRVLGSFIKGDPDQIQIPAEMDWDQLNRWITAHNLGPFFHHALRRDTLPGNLQQQWQQIGMTILLDNLRALKTATSLFSILESAGIRAAAMRGLSLVNRIYPESGIRGMRDVDILISPRDREPLLKAMRAENYEPDQFLRSQYVYKIKGVTFEIHWSLLTAKRYRETIDSHVMLDSRMALDTPDGRIFCLSNHHELMGLITHAFVHHELTIMKQLVDIGLFAMHQTIDWDHIYHWCSGARLTNMFGLTLGLVERLFYLDQELDTGPFKGCVPGMNPKGFDAYIEPFFGKTGLGRYLRLKKNLFFVAEDPLTKLNQFFRLITLTEARDIYNRYFSKP
jgi:Uncharacterised nucleotidyltransferase